MVKKIKKQVIAFLLTAIMLVGTFGSATAEAAVPKLQTTEDVCYVEKPLMSYCYGVENINSPKQITNLKSSDPSVATVSTDSGIGNTKVSILALAKKPGKAVISFTAKYGVGLKKTKKLKMTLTVKKYENPCQSFKIGTKNYASEFKDSTFGMMKNPGKKLKVSVKARSGWKLDHIYVMSRQGQSKNIKNNTTLNLKKFPSVYATFRNKKTGDYVSVGLTTY